MKIKDYEILTSSGAWDSRLDLLEQVQEHIKKGWQPFGGISIVKDVDNQHVKTFIFSQAMIKKQRSK